MELDAVIASQGVSQRKNKTDGFFCRDCKKRFNVRTNTIFHRFTVKHSSGEYAALCASFLRASFLCASFLRASFLRASFLRASFLCASFLCASFLRASFLRASFLRGVFPAKAGISFISNNLNLFI